MDKELIIEIIKYIKDSEDTLAALLGPSKDIGALIEDGDMPKLYYRLAYMLNEGK